MTSYNREKIREFFKAFWSNPNNVRKFEEGRAQSTLGKVDKFGRRYSTREDAEELARELGMPILEFRVS